ncbi:phosphatase PAP2 family protein [Lysobacter tyrosinilyticus]
MRALPLFALCTLWLLPLPARAGGPFLIDHRVTYDDSGIWKRSYQKDLAAGLALTTIGGAVFGDNDTRLGRTFDQALDSMVLTAGTTTAMKFVFSRERPSQNASSSDFFDGSGYGSFPSGEVAEMAAVVTPFIAEYHDDHPAVYALALLPAYDAVARVKVRGHWQSDVLVGAAVGVGIGLYAHHRKTPLIMGLMPHGGVMLGYAKKF